MTTTRTLARTLDHEAPHQSPVGRTRSRRDVLRAAGLTGMTIVVAGTGALAYRVYDNAVLTPGAGHAYDPWTQWQDTPGSLGAIACAVLAASPHNTQPWTFTATDRLVELHVDPRRGTGTVDPLRREQYVGVGCALENLILGARARGLAPVVETFPDGEESTLVARVDLSPGPEVVGDLYRAIGSRHTNRGPYAARAVSPEVLDSLVDSTGLPGVSATWLDTPPARAEMSSLLVDAAEALVRDEEQSRDGFEWFRGSQDEIDTHRDGLVLDGQAMPPLVLGVAKLLPPSSRTAGDRFWVEQTRSVHTATAAAYGVISADEPERRRAQLDAGRLLQRTHLAATSRGVALHHMNQVTERIDRERTSGAPATFAPRFAALLPPGRSPLLTFRVGYPLRTARPTPRRTARSVTR